MGRAKASLQSYRSEARKERGFRSGMIVKSYAPPPTPLDEREEWEGDDPECYMEELQPLPVLMFDLEMVTLYEEVEA